MMNFLLVLALALLSASASAQNSAAARHEAASDAASDPCQVNLLFLAYCQSCSYCIPGRHLLVVSASCVGAPSLDAA